LMCRGDRATAGLRTIGAKIKHSPMINTVDLFRSFMW
jgi:hypothetical protein